MRASLSLLLLLLLATLCNAIRITALVETTQPVGSFVSGAGLVSVKTSVCNSTSQSLWQLQADSQDVWTMLIRQLTRKGVTARAVSFRGDALVTINAIALPPAPWNLDRIDQRNLPLDGIFSTDGVSGAGVNIYSVDTGVQFSADLAGRVHQEWSAYASFDDCHGHGTHVAGTAAGTIYGVAKQATIRAYRALGCDGSGSLADLADALFALRSNLILPAVINLSLEYGGFDSTIDTLLKDLMAMGVSVVAAAGNSNADACGTYPCSTQGAICVGATTRSDARASFSNFGSCVDLYGPGEDVVSDWLGNSTNTLSGTSMATPIVSGIIALYKSLFPSASTSAVATAVVNAATPNVLTGASPNRLAYDLLSPTTTTTTILTITTGVPPSPPPASAESSAPALVACCGIVGSLLMMMLLLLF